jgi:hypothetical protein
MLPHDIEALQALQPGEGVTHDSLSNADYHHGPGLSVSGAKRLLVTPYHYHALTGERTAPPKAPTPGMVNGTLVHCLVLEPDEFGTRYTVSPEGVDPRSKAWREYCAQAVAAGLDVITPAMYERAKAQAEALRAVPEVAELLNAEGFIAEQSVYWRDEAHGLLLKCRPGAPWRGERAARCQNLHGRQRRGLCLGRREVRLLHARPVVLRGRRGCNRLARPGHGVRRRRERIPVCRACRHVVRRSAPRGPRGRRQGAQHLRGVHHA